jgi:hypothetical protein
VQHGYLRHDLDLGMEVDVEDLGVSDDEAQALLLSITARQLPAGRPLPQPHTSLLFQSGDANGNASPVAMNAAQWTGPANGGRSGYARA